MLIFAIAVATFDAFNTLTFVFKPDTITLPVVSTRVEFANVKTVELPNVILDVVNTTFEPTETFAERFAAGAFNDPVNVAEVPNRFQRFVVLPKFNPLTLGTKSPSATEVPVYVKTPATVKFPPTEILPEIFALPITCKSALGVIVLIPTLLFTESTNRTPESIFTFEVAIVTTFCVAFEVTLKLLIAALPVTLNVANVPTAVIPVYEPDIKPLPIVPVIFVALV